jgi:hypothetical protein
MSPPDFVVVLISLKHKQPIRTKYYRNKTGNLNLSSGLSHSQLLLLEECPNLGKELVAEAAVWWDFHQRGS